MKRAYSFVFVCILTISNLCVGADIQRTPPAAPTQAADEPAFSECQICTENAADPSQPFCSCKGPLCEKCAFTITACPYCRAPFARIYSASLIQAIVANDVEVLTQHLNNESLLKNISKENKQAMLNTALIVATTEAIQKPDYDLHIINTLINAGANPNTRALNPQAARPLHYAADHQHEELIDLLLTRGANPLLKDGKKYMPLHYAVKKDNTNIVNNLLKARADINTPDGENEITPLHTAVIAEKLPIVRILVERAQATINAKSKIGTPLHYAAFNGSQQMIAYLLSKGANPDAPYNATDARRPVDLIPSSVPKDEQLALKKLLKQPKTTRRRLFF